MKRIINGKMYNTETAILIAQADSGGSQSDFQWWEETLYKSPKGQYFLEGEGGAMTRYARSCGQNSVGPGEEIMLLSPKDALQWIQEHEIEITEEIEKEFAGIISIG